MATSWLRRILARPALLAGWSKVNDNAGAPGIDEVTVAQFAHRLDAEIVALQKEVLSGEYTPKPLRSVWIRPEGKKLREIAIPVIRDRVLQSSCAQIIGPTLEAEFEDCSFAYRQGRSVRQAVQRIESLRNEGYKWVVDADIRSFFDEIPHDALIAALRELVPDEALLALIRKWLMAPIRRNGIDHPRSRGIAQGSPLSPALANLYLDQLDEAILDELLRIVRFADDFVVLCRTPKRAEEALELTTDVLKQLELRLHPVKTRLTSFDEGFKFLGHYFVRSLTLPARYHDTPSVIEEEEVGAVDPVLEEGEEAEFQPLPEVAPALRVEAQTTPPTNTPVTRPQASNQQVIPVPLHNYALGNALRSALKDHPGWLRHETDRDSGEATPNPIVESPQAVSQSPLRTLYILDYGATLSREGEKLVVRKEETELLAIPVIRADLVIVLGQHGITTPAMQLCMLRGVPIALVGRQSGAVPRRPHRTAGVVIMAVWSIVCFNVLPNYKIDVLFADGTTGVADLAPRLSQGPLGDGFDALCDESVFT